MNGYRVWDTWDEKFVGDIILLPSGRLARLTDGYAHKDFPSDRYSVEFSTGIKDKDNNEIYIGDIVIWESRLYKVVWRESDCSIILENDYDEVVECLDNFHKYTYIGNCHKNKEIWENI